MDIKNIHTFIRAAELKSFTKVAQESNYAQSTVTAQIQQLERELGYPLFDRIGKTVSLTCMGEEFLKYAHVISEQLSKAHSLNEGQEEIKGVLRIGVIESLLFANLKNIIPRFRSTFKNVNVQIKMGQTTELVEMLKQNKLDLIYISADKNTDDELSCEYVKEEHLVFISSPTHILSSADIISPKELFKYDFAVTEQTGVCYGRLKALASENDSVLHTIVEVDNTAVVSEIVEEGLGIGFLPEYSIHKRITNNELKILNVDVPAQIYYRQILCHKNRWHSLFLNTFIEMLKNE